MAVEEHREGIGRRVSAAAALPAVYLLDIGGLDEAAVERALALLPTWRQEKALAFKHVQGRKECAFSFLLLRQALEEAFGFTGNLEFEYSEHGKPALKGWPDIHFNLSHCSSAVACAVSYRPVGIDVERFGRYKESLAKSVLSDEEFAAVEQSAAPDRAFTALWTKKEALLKLLGTGVGKSMKNVLAENNDKKITTTECNGYMFSVAE